MNNLSNARRAWLSLAPLRAKRSRLKNFTYGNQWDDECYSTDGRRMSEMQRMNEEGRVPITNNIIRQMVKSIVGRYRFLNVQTSAEAGSTSLLSSALKENASPQADADARTLEEFLISGMAIQRIEQGEGVPVSPERFFFTPFLRADGSDCRLMGMLHDLSPAEVISRFGQGDPQKCAAIKEAFRSTPLPDCLPLPGNMLSFETAAIPGTWRVIEIWEKSAREWIEITDPFNQTLTCADPSQLPRYQAINKARAELGTDPLTFAHKAEERWHMRIITPAGNCLHEELGGQPPFVIRFYPMIDGEIHSLVEDVLPQQKYINRLISLLDHIISSSAKGVLLYPADQLPDGFTWRDLRRIWSTPNGIMPYKLTRKGVHPEQVHTGSAIGAGATDMLKTQLQLFDEISGSTGAMRGSSSRAQGEGMFLAELENATISLLDLLASFSAFISQRNKLL